MNQFFTNLRQGLAARGAVVVQWYRNNRLMFIGGVTILGIVLIVWARVGFSFQLSRFFAAEPPTFVIDTGHGPYKHGDVATFSWAASNATRCDASGWINTGGSNTGNGIATSPINACASATRNIVVLTCTYSGGDTGVAQTYLDVDTTSCPGTGATPTPTSSTPPTGGGAVRCPGRASDPPSWVPDSALVWLCKRVPFEDQFLDQQCVAYNEANRRSSGGEYGYKTDWPQIDGPTWTFPQWCVEYQANCPEGWGAFGQLGCKQATSGGGSTPTPIPGTSRTPTPFPGTPTPTPVASVVCAPRVQTVNVGQVATLDVTGGQPNAAYQWSSEGQVPQGAHVTFTYATPGDRAVTVTSGGQTDTCTIHVQGTATVTPTPTVTPAMTVAVTGRNATTSGAEGTTVPAIGGQQVEFIMHIRNTSATAILGDVNVVTSLPAGIAYVAGSTTLNGASAVDIVGLNTQFNVGAIGQQQEAVVRFRAQVNSSAFPVGTSSAIVTMQANAAGTPSQSGAVTVSVTRAAAQVGTVQTGPGDAVLVALLVSGVATLLYVSYASSPAFRRKEVDSISDRHDPMDFRS